MSITYGPSGSSFVVRLGGRVVQRARTEAGAEAAAVRLSAQFGGEVVRDTPQQDEPVAVDAAEPIVEPIARAVGIDTPPDFHAVLDLPIAKLRERLAVGDLDEHLVALDAAERQGKTRTGALAAIADRRKTRTAAP